MMGNDYLFSQRKIEDFLSVRENLCMKSIQNELNTLGYDNAEEFESSIIKKFTIQKIELKETEIKTDCIAKKIANESPLQITLTRNTHIDGFAVRFHIPFVGDENLFYATPKNYTFNRPTGTLKNNTLIVEIETKEFDNKEYIYKLFNIQLQVIKYYVASIDSDVDRFNSTIIEKIRKKLETYRNQLKKAQEISEGLGFSFLPNTQSGKHSTSENQQVISKSNQSSSEESKNNKISLSMDVFENIIKIIQGSADMMERNYKSFNGLGEEQLRDLLLSSLNSHYENRVHAEASNASGHTDIMVKLDDGQMFIAECKVWKGRKYLLDAIDQLFSYSSWKDAKTAIIIFNRSGNHSNILGKISSIMTSHPKFKSEIKREDKEFRYTMEHPEDKKKDMLLSILIFNIPKK